MAFNKFDLHNIRVACYIKRYAGDYDYPIAVAHHFYLFCTVHGMLEQFFKRILLKGQDRVYAPSKRKLIIRFLFGRGGNYRLEWAEL